MNIVLTIFVVLSAMFASASVNNMIAVYGGIDYFFDKTGMADYMILTRAKNGVDQTGELVKEAKAVTDYKKEDVIYYSAANLKKDGQKYASFENAGLVLSYDDAKLNYYSDSDELIAEPAPGHVYLGGILADPDKTTIGDEVVLDFGDVKVSVIIDGYIKDPLFGSPFLGNPRMIMNRADADVLKADKTVADNYSGAVYYINTDDMKLLTTELSNAENTMFGADNAKIRMTYMLDMLVAGLLLVVSICLILIAFTMLSFTIKFTLEEDFREIGVMKAVGLENRSIRLMYMVKYLCLSAVGAVIGYIGSIPFGNILLKSVTKNLVIGNENRVFVGILSSIAVVLLILAFCYSCTKKINKLSPIDAVHNGETGERYHRRSFLRLSKSRLGSNLFLAVNDVFSKPRQYASMTVTFTMCILLIAMLANASNTLMSDKLVFLLGTTTSDVYFSSTEKIMGSLESDDDYQKKVIAEIEQTLADNGMPGRVHQELMYQVSVTYKDEKMQVSVQHCPDTKTTDYVFEDGVAPLYANEVAFTPQVLDDLGAKIGDRVTIEINGVSSEYVITASIISLNQLGKSGRLHQDVDIKTSTASSAYAFQIDFDDHPDAATIDERVEKLKDIFDTDKIYDASGFVDVSTGSAAAIGTAKNMVLIIAIVIAALISVLMERSFISKETSEIALMKAIGFKNRWISVQHTCRFIVVLLISLVIATALNYPATKLVCDRIFAVMGAVSGIVYDIKPLEVFGLYPLILTAAVVTAAGFTSMYARTIHADSMGNIE